MHDHATAIELAQQRVEHVPQESVGTPGFRKGTDLLLQALDKLTGEFDFELTMVGTVSGAYFEAECAKVSPELRRRMVFRKNLSPPEVAEEMARATMLVLPTIT